MAAGAIISVLSNIPWGQVLENAPKLADGATKLWYAVRRKKPEPSTDTDGKTAADSAHSETEFLKQRLAAMDEHIIRLEEQMSASAELIKALAEQNTQLVRKIELNSVRLLRLATAAVGAVLLLAASIAYLLPGP